MAARSAAAALIVFDPEVYALVVTDNSWPGMTGAELARVLKHWWLSTPIVMFTGAAPANRAGPDAVLQRPVPMQVLREVVDGLLAERS